MSLLIFHNFAFPGSTKDAPIVTPLMDYIRQKRAAKGVSRVRQNLLLNLLSRLCIHLKDISFLLSHSILWDGGFNFTFK